MRAPAMLQAMRSPHYVLLVHALLCLTALTWPVYPWLAERVDLRPLGIPFPFAWHVFWILATFFVVGGVDRALHPAATDREGEA